MPAEEKLSLPGEALAERDEFLERLGRKVGGHDRDQRHRRDHRHPGEILHRIERDVLVDDGRDGVAVGGQHQGVAVGRAPRHGRRPGKPGLVLHDHDLLPHGAQLVGDHAGHAVGDAAGAERDDDRHLPRGIGLRRRLGWRQHGAASQSDDTDCDPALANLPHGTCLLGLVRPGSLHANGGLLANAAQSLAPWPLLSTIAISPRSLRIFISCKENPFKRINYFNINFQNHYGLKIRIFIKNLSNLPLWINIDISSTIFGGKQNYAFWQTIFESGKTSANVQVLSEPLDLMEMITNKL